MDEQSFLAGYDANNYPTPLFSVDAVLFTYHEGALKVLLVERSSHPEKGKWGLPGGFVDLDADQTVEDTVRRKLKEKTGVEPLYIEQLMSVGNHSRDQRGWSVTLCYTALIAHQDCAARIDTVSDVQWVELDTLADLSLAFDHAEIISAARERLRQKALYSIVPAFALPEPFTLPELQQVHEVLIGKTLQKKSFRRRIEQADLLEETGEQRREGGRPAALYRMRPHSKDHNFLRNLEV